MRHFLQRRFFLVACGSALGGLALAALAGQQPTAWAGAAFLALAASFLLAELVGRTVNERLDRLSLRLEQLSRGDASLADAGSENGLAALDQPLNRIADWSQQTSSLLQAALESDLRHRLPERGDKDSLSRLINALLDEIDRTHQEYAKVVRYLHAIPTPVLVIDRDFTIQFANKAASRAARRSVGECIGKKCHELFKTHDCRGDACMVARAMLQDRILTGENLIVTQKGEIPFRYTGAPLKNDEGQIIGAIEYSVDIRDEIRIVDLAEEVSRGNYNISIPLRSEHDRLGVALNRMTDILRELAGKMEEENWLAESAVAINDRLHGEHDLESLAYNVLDVLADTTGALVGAFYLAQDEETLRLVKTLATEGGISGRQLIGRGEGLIGRAIAADQAIVVNDLPTDYFPLSSGIGKSDAASIIILPVYFENRLYCVIELGSHRPLGQHDTTLLERVKENIGVAVHSTLARLELKRLLDLNEKQTEQLQVQQEELRQTNEELQEQTRTLAASEERLQVQQEELRVSNEELEERSKALEEKNREVESKNRELNLARKELEKKAGDLETSGRYKSEFLANMSHELRTPLNSILILSQLLAANKEANLSAKQVEFSTTIHQSGSDLLHLINEVLDLSKIEAGRMEIHPETLELAPLVDGILMPFKQMAMEKGVELKSSIDPGLPGSIVTDDLRLRQVLKNLLSNAFKFTEKGSVSIEVGKLQPENTPPGLLFPPERGIFFKVSDSGIGIPKDKLEIIFEAFKQADGTTSRKFGGTGLGLSISRELARLLGGTLTVESTEGQGSSFTLSLPLQLEAAKVLKAEKTSSQSEKPRTPPAEARKPAPKPTPAPAVNAPPEDSDKDVRDDRRSIKAGDKTLLIIEDDPAFASLLLDLSRERGFKGLIAGDGEAGLHLADYYRPDAIVLDMGLPGINGQEVLERLKKNPETRHIPVHFISANDQSSDLLQMGAIGYLTKPVSVDKLDAVFGRIEKLIQSPVKKLLVIEDNAVQRQAIKALIGDGDVLIREAANGEEAYRLLLAEYFDCIILDLGLEDMSGFDLLTRIKEKPELTSIPIVIYTGRDISQEEQDQLQRYADSIIIKGARSPERLLDETTLFLHRIEKKLPKEQQKILSTLHKRDAAFEGRRVLLVDDDMRNVFALTAVLEENGLETIVARNGREAIEKLGAHPETDLVLMDIMMPEMDGYEAMRRIRLNGKYRDLPIIALTAKAMKGDRDKCLEAGANDYLSKPIDSAKLLSLLRVWLYR